MPVEDRAMDDTGQEVASVLLQVSNHGLVWAEAQNTQTRLPKTCS